MFSFTTKIVRPSVASNVPLILLLLLIEIILGYKNVEKKD